MAEKTIIEELLEKVKKAKAEGAKYPSDFDVEGALKSAYIILKDLDTGKTGGYKPVLTACTRVSIIKVLSRMVDEGLNPLKKQCAFSAWKGELQYHRQYAGNIALAKRYADVKEINAHIIYTGDIFKYKIDITTGRKVITDHEPDIDNQSINKVKGAVSIAVFNDGTYDLEYMTKEQIRTAWAQNRGNKGNGDVHKTFTDQMAKKSVINRQANSLINGSIGIEDDAVSEIIPDVAEAGNKAVVDAEKTPVVDTDRAFGGKTEMIAETVPEVLPEPTPEQKQTIELEPTPEQKQAIEPEQPQF